MDKKLKETVKSVKKIGKVYFVEADHYDEIDFQKERQNHSPTRYSARDEYKRIPDSMSATIKPSPKDKTKPGNKSKQTNELTIEGNGQDSDVTRESRSLFKRLFTRKDKQDQRIIEGKPPSRTISSSAEKNTSETGMYKDVTLISPKFHENKIVVIATADGQQHKMSFSWTTDIKNGILFYDNVGKLLLQSDTNGNNTCSLKIKQPSAIIRVSLEQVTTLCVNDKSCKNGTL
ncbi:hypothetical protein DPMN_036774 [Dreissena polymorpha]|uniref:Uncharacterized protein n=1 Tax=Dreissena polymorpha TaxID=45954 RepID=A0A9D4MDL9_DREPO|nr:hypothetical protein DPMN_036774 [Dreissena polymorpha]